MGVPRFYKFISDTFPTVSKRTCFRRGFRTEKQVDGLYLDANGILHGITREVYFSDEYKDIPLDEKHILVNKKILEAIDKLFHFVEPSSVFYIGIDGTAPVSKQCQQRQRRYKASLERSDDEYKIFDSTAITPGTGFMERLDVCIKEYVRVNNIIYPNIEIIYSGHNDPGEAEHKIVNYIRSLENNGELTHCLYGLDGDLFFLSLATHCPKFYLLREDQFNKISNDTFFYIVDIQQLRQDLHAKWGGDSEKRLINDFIFTSFLIGNDFLHNVPCFHNLEHSIPLLMSIRRETFNESEYIITKQGRIDMDNLLLLFQAVAIHEKKLIDELYYKNTFENLTYNNSLIDPLRPQDGVDLELYKKNYYSKFLNSQKDVPKLCKAYLQTLQWVQYYYHNEPNNWRWYFPYHYTPMLSDIIKYLESVKTIPTIALKKLLPLTANEQLLCVVPPKSIGILPETLRESYTKMLKYYPENVKIDLEGKLKDWEGIARLPFIDEI